MSQSSQVLTVPIQSLSIKHYFHTLQDPRRRHRRLHRLMDIVAIAICAVLCGADNWQDVALFGQRRQAWLKRFLVLPNGIPSHDTFERVFDQLHPPAFQACFRAWIKAVAELLPSPHIALDGKTLRGSGSSELGPLQLISAWATDQHLLLGQEAVATGSNEIAAFPRLLELLDLHGALVTIDAAGCQKNVARQIVDQAGNYVLTVKDNQPTLAADVQKIVATGAAPREHHVQVTTERGHGREETRIYHVVSLPDGFAERHAEWAGLRSLGMVLSERQVSKQPPSYEARYFISSLEPRVRTFARAVRKHWSIENSLAWHMDVTFGEDDSRICRRHGAENFALLRRWSLCLLKQHPTKQNIACKRFAAALDSDFLEKILQIAGV